MMELLKRTAMMLFVLCSFGSTASAQALVEGTFCASYQQDYADSNLRLPASHRDDWCGDNRGLEPDATSDVEVETINANRASPKIVLHGPLTSGTFTPSFACKSLEGATFVALPFEECGMTTTVSDCHWDASTQRCECTVTVEQPC